MSDEDFFRANNRPEPATVPQLRYYRSLIGQRDIRDMAKELPDQWLQVMVNLTKAINGNTDQDVYESKAFAKSDLINFIDRLRKCPTIPQLGCECGPSGDPRTDAVTYGSFSHGIQEVMCPPKPIALQELQDGMYRNPNTGTIYKVYHTVHGNNIQVAKRLIVDKGDHITEGYSNPDKPQKAYKAKFKYEGRAPLKFLKPEYRLTLKHAREFGALYGTCCVCARTLTNELSIHLGIGPVCGDREFGGDFQFLVDEAKLKLGAKVPNPASKHEHVGDIADWNHYTEE